MSATFKISNPLTTEFVNDFLNGDFTIQIDEEAFHAIEKCHNYLLKKIAEPGALYYGINTGFGSLCDTQINHDDLHQLQENLLMSHACGMGETVPDDVVRLMLLFKIKSLSLGYSGVKTETVQRLTDMLNNGLYPLVYKQGSLGASGDLAPLAHLCLPLIGKGKIGTTPTKEVLASYNWKPVELGPKEGLALINGTQFMTAYGMYSLNLAKKLLVWADYISAISLEAYDALIAPFSHQIHDVRKQPGQIKVAANISTILADSKIVTADKNHVQDPYSFRCIPQVHGAILDVVNQVEQVFINEINAVTDNPNIFVDDDLILSGGNFHGEPLAFQADFLAIAMSELANISERRIFNLISGERGLPKFLTPNPGLNSGFMIPQYTAASVVSLNKQLCTPSSVDSIVSSNGQEDHVSMGANGMLKLIRVVENVRKVLAIELFTACQALEFRGTNLAASKTLKVVNLLREEVPFIQVDTEMHEWMAYAETLINTKNPENL